MDFYEILGQIMDEKKMGITDVARTCGLTDSTVRSIFDRHQKKIALNVAFKLADGLDVSLERLNGQPDQITKKSLSTSGEEDNNDQIVLVPDERQLIEDYRGLNEQGKELIRQQMELAVESPRYKKYADPSNVEKQA